MQEQDKREYLEKYQEQKKKGIPFFPDALFKDAVVALGLFVLLVLLSAVVGAVLDERADPAAEFDPKPEWYFLFIFQLLKYFPGSVEFLGAIVLPGLVVLALFALPWLDRSNRRHFSARPVVMGVSGVALVGALGLTAAALLEEAPPSATTSAGDTVAHLYVENCAGCHGATLTAPADVNLVEVIAAGSHDGMPSWSADLSAEEIDALAGFIASPQGSVLFNQTCAACHEVIDLVDSRPVDIRSALEGGNNFGPHGDVSLPESIAALTRAERTALTNFLAAPDGQRLFALNCSSCHGSAPVFTGTAEELRQIIQTGGGHLDMPAMAGVLSEETITVLAEYVVAPTDDDETIDLFEANCATCHGSRIPRASSVEAARTAIAMGGGHETMPVWGEVLTAEQLDALTTYALEASQGTGLAAGQAIYAQQCAVCHGEFGEGGVSPANPAIVIPPISTASYLTTRDDATLRAIISRGQPDFGMSPFSLSFGGSLDEADIDSVVAFIRAWEADPPVELPPTIERAPLLGTGPEIFAEFCSQCHGAAGEGGIGPSFQDPAFHDRFSDEELFETVNLGHAATAMIAWGEVLTDEQMTSLVAFMRDLEESEDGTTTTVPSRTDVSFQEEILPIFQAECTACHRVGSALGGWAADSYAATMTTGNNAPVVIAGDPDGSWLVQLLEGRGGSLMPPAGSLPDSDIQLIRDWIAAGALEN